MSRGGEILRIKKARDRLLYLLLSDKHSGKNLTGRTVHGVALPLAKWRTRTALYLFSVAPVYSTVLARCPRCICVIARCRAQQILYWTPFAVYRLPRQSQ